MNRRFPWSAWLMAGSLILAGCCPQADRAETTPAAEPGSPAIPAPEPAEPAPAAPAPTEPAPAGPAPTEPAAAEPAAAETDTTAKLDGVAWAERQEQIKQDPAGQWALLAVASSSYRDAKDNEPFSPRQATGAPDVETCRDDPRAWAPKTANSGLEWITLDYERAVYAAEVRIRESFGAGAVIRVELADAQGAFHTVWSGADPTTGLNYLIVRFGRTPYATRRVKITLATNTVSGWNEIDAVQLVAAIP